MNIGQPAANKVGSFTPVKDKSDIGFGNVASNRGLRSDLQRLHDAVMTLDDRLNQLKTILEPVRLPRPSAPVGKDSATPVRSQLSEWVHSETDRINMFSQEIENLISEVEI